jgi:hypothetical protein
MNFANIHFGTGGCRFHPMCLGSLVDNVSNNF